jgi:hypothetical protein
MRNFCDCGAIVLWHNGMWCDAQAIVAGNDVVGWATSGPHFCITDDEWAAEFDRDWLAHNISQPEDPQQRHSDGSDAGGSMRP